MSLRNVTLLTALLALTTQRAVQGQTSSSIVTVSAATSRSQPAARDMILTSYGQKLATATAQASSTPLPNVLTGTTLKLVDSKGWEGYSQLFFVSPKQVNWLMPDWVGNGTVKPQDS